jgi:CDP-glycerol glycerophosphotransferase (TagB/SpsB family)
MIDRAAGIIYGPLEHHLDHLAPFCSLLQIPLILTEEELVQKARLYYPELEILHWDCLEAPFKTAQSFDTLFYSTPRIFFDEVFFIAEATLGKKIKTIWLPHGNSDKGHASYFMEGLKDEQILLIYGKKMIDFLAQKNIHKPSCCIGNFRLEYYHRHKVFYDSWIQKLHFPSQKIILYAPTWQDGENSSSFFSAIDPLILQLPEDYFLLIKLHPNLEKDIRCQQLILQYEHLSNIRFLTGFTPVYPLLEKADVYMGDMSSIGYDFLTFNRPMYFFNPADRHPSDPGLYLHQCGRCFQKDDYLKIFDIIRQDDQSHLTPVRAETYAYTFGNQRPWKQIQDELSIR